MSPTRKPGLEDIERICWCIRCSRYIGDAAKSRSTLMETAKEHWERYGKNHGIWFELSSQRRPLPSTIASDARAFDPSRADDHREEYLRGGLR